MELSRKQRENLEAGSEENASGQKAIPHDLPASVLFFICEICHADYCRRKKRICLSAHK
jgi:hypothetical protein